MLLWASQLIVPQRAGRELDCIWGVKRASSLAWLRQPPSACALIRFQLPTGERSIKIYDHDVGNVHVLFRSSLHMTLSETG